MKGSNDIIIVASAIKEECIGSWSNSMGKMKGQKAFPPENPHMKSCGTSSQELTRRLGRKE